MADPVARIDALQAETDELTAALEQSRSRSAALEADNASLKNRQSQYQYSLPLTWVGGAILVCLVGGFLFGLWWVDHQSRKRHGGIRIY